jgi:hypothetical protein
VVRGQGLANNIALAAVYIGLLLYLANTDIPWLNPKIRAILRIRLELGTNVRISYPTPKPATVNRPENSGSGTRSLRLATRQNLPTSGRARTEPTQSLGKPTEYTAHSALGRAIGGIPSGCLPNATAVETRARTFPFRGRERSRLE